MDTGCFLYHPGIITQLLAALSVPAVGLFAGSPGGAPPDKPYTIEYYYKIRWGFADEFIRLFRKNHLPLLQKQVEMGRILKVSAARPRLHGTEDGRWDYRVTLVFKGIALLNDGFDEAALAKSLFPDQDTFRKEEQRRFEILLAHWDLPVEDVDLQKP